MSPATNAALRQPAAAPAFELPAFHLGPMSLHVVDAALALTQKLNTSLCLIGSRRQIECMALGGGYVNGWTTETLAAYVRDRDPAGRIVLARDHGGPYQREEENGLSLTDAMERAKASFRADINSGLKILHLDPEKAVKRGQPDTLENFTNLTIEMLTYAGTYAAAQGQNVLFEVGTDEGPGEDFTPEEWAVFLENVFAACDKNNLPYPVTFAVPMGTKVKELRNVGGLVANPQERASFWQDRIAALQKLAARYGLDLKLHNSDYLNGESVANYRRLGVKYVNVAPEFGVVESRTILTLLRENGLDDIAAQFVALAIASNKWQRWLLPGSQPSDDEKALIAGHYIFAQPEFRALKHAARTQLTAKGIDLDWSLQTAIEKAIQHYLA